MKTKLYPVKRDESKPYWDKEDLNRLISFNADVTIAMSPRDYGKSYAGRSKLWEYMQKGEDVAWGRYNAKELGRAVSTWKTMFPELKEMSSGNGTKVLKDECSGGAVHFVYWNISQNMKDTDFRNGLRAVVYDEFIPERYTQKPRMDTEFDDWYSVDTSISRDYNPLRVMIANNIYWQNPFFLTWEIAPFPKGYIMKSVNHLEIQTPSGPLSSDFTVAMENVAGTHAIIERNIKQQAIRFRNKEDMERYYDNETKQEYTAIGQCPDKSVTFANLQFMSEGYYMSYRRFKGVYYWSKVKYDMTKPTYVSEPAYIDMGRNHIRKNGLAYTVEDMFNHGLFVFDSGQTVIAMLRWLRHMRGRV